MRRRFRQSIYSATLLVTIAMPGRLNAGPPGDEVLSHWVTQLGAESYASRKRAERRLFELATRNAGQFQRVHSRLRIQCDPQSNLELYLAKRRLLASLETHAREIQLDRFLYDPSFDDRTVIGWSRFSRHAGDGLDARLMYAAMVRKHPSVGQQIEDRDLDSIRLVDLDLIDRHDASTWSILLWSACENQSNVADQGTLRLTATLRCMGTGPSAQRDHERRVESRLINSYLQRSPVDLRDRIVIALRYKCLSMVETDCRAILGDPTQSPSRIVTAMLAASSLNFSPGEIDDWLEIYRNDSRVSHVWRSLIPPKTTHRTQVRDVALALKLHRSGIDPRTRGFTALVADPILVFRPHSLGFESDQMRTLAHHSQAVPTQALGE